VDEWLSSLKKESLIHEEYSVSVYQAFNMNTTRSSAERVTEQGPMVIPRKRKQDVRV
jgi:hypothetical protein